MQSRSNCTEKGDEKAVEWEPSRAMSDDERRLAAAVWEGRAPLGEAAEAAGVSEGVMAQWALALSLAQRGLSAGAREPPAGGARLAVARAGAGLVLMARDIGRDGRWAQTWRRVAGAPVGAGARLAARPLAQFDVPLADLEALLGRTRDALALVG